MNILYIGEFRGFVGGIEHFMHQSALLLRRYRWRVDCCALKPEREEPRFASGFDRVFGVREALASAAEYDLVVLHKVPEYGLFRELEAAAGRRLVFWAHDHELYCPGGSCRASAWKRGCQRAFHPLHCAFCTLIARNGKAFRELPGFLRERHRLIAALSRHPTMVLSEFMRQNLLKNGFHRHMVQLIHPFRTVCERDHAFMLGGEIKIIYVGRLFRRKGLEDLLAALRRVRVPFSLRIVGDGDDRARLEAMASHHRLAGRVGFTGWCAAPEIYWRQADLAVFPFRWQEPFGLGGLEAASFGLPVIVSDTGGVREWLKDRVNGRLVPAGNPEALARTIEWAAASPLRLWRMGQAGAALVRSIFPEEKFVNTFFNMVENLPRL